MIFKIKLDNAIIIFYDSSELHLNNQFWPNAAGIASIFGIRQGIYKIFNQNFSSEISKLFLVYNLLELPFSLKNQTKIINQYALSN